MGTPIHFSPPPANPEPNDAMVTVWFLNLNFLPQNHNYSIGGTPAVPVHIDVILSILSHINIT
jgi:hypothetical protein